MTMSYPWASFSVTAAPEVGHSTAQHYLLHVFEKVLHKLGNFYHKNFESYKRNTIFRTVKWTN